jgi:hypothetical protein
MAFKKVSSFEILCQPIAPGIPNVPYVQQGYFVQVTNTGASAIKVSIQYISTPDFVASVPSPVSSPFGPVPAAITLFADFINASGKPGNYPLADFLPPPVTPGFKSTSPALAAIDPGKTFLFGVQYLLNTGNATMTGFSGSTPQDTIAARGYAQIEAPAGSTILVLATIRQFFSNYGPNGTILDFSEGAYAPPLLEGPALSF